MATYGYLMHFGIKGQKWGIRRYQNPDGSLTAEGRARYGYSSSRSPEENFRNYEQMKKDFFIIGGDSSKYNEEYYMADEKLKQDISNFSKYKEKLVKGERDLADNIVNSEKFKKVLQDTDKIKKSVEKDLDNVYGDNSKDVYFEYLDQAFQQAIAKEFYKDKNVKKLTDDFYKLKNDNETKVKDYVTKLVGNVGDKKLNGNNYWTFKDEVTTSINKLINKPVRNQYNIETWKNTSSNDILDYVKGSPDRKVIYLSNIILDNLDRNNLSNDYYEKLREVENKLVKEGWFFYD